MEFLAGVWVAIIAMVLTVAFSDHRVSTTYPMMVKAESTCYSNHGIKEVDSRQSGLTVICNNGAKFEFTEEDYRNE